MLWFCLSKVTVKEISSWAALHVIFLVFLVICIKIATKVVSVLCPEWIFLFLFFAANQIIHFGASSFSKTHILYCQILWTDLLTLLTRLVLWILRVLVISLVFIRLLLLVISFVFNRFSRRSNFSWSFFRFLIRATWILIFLLFSHFFLLSFLLSLLLKLLQIKTSFLQLPSSCFSRLLLLYHFSGCCCGLAIFFNMCRLFGCHYISIKSNL